MKKTNRIPKIKGKRKSKTVIIIKNQKDFDKACEHSVEYRKGNKWNQNKDTLYRYMACKRCGQMEIAGHDATAITCSDCVNEMVEPPEFKRSKISSGRPAGWHFMSEYVDKDGNVYHRGKEQSKLKGTLPETIVEKKQKISKNERNQMITQANVKVHNLKKVLLKAKLKKHIKKLKREIAKNQKIASGKIPRSMRYRVKDLDKS